MAAPVITRINDNVVRMGTRILNWYLLADDEGVTIVDAAVPGYRIQLGPGLRELGRTLADVRAVVLTHAHPDHIGCAEQLRQELDIPVYVHRDDEQLATTRKQFGKTDSSMLPYFRYPMSYRLMAELARGGAMRTRPIGEVTRFDDRDELPVHVTLRVSEPASQPLHALAIDQAAEASACMKPKMLPSGSLA